MVDLFLGLDSSSSVSTRVPPDDICQGLDTPLVNPRILATVTAGQMGTHHMISLYLRMQAEQWFMCKQ
jgi:hypothetical protein